MATFHALFTVVLFVIFVGIWCWAYSRKRQSDFAEAAQLPFLNEEDELR